MIVVLYILKAGNQTLNTDKKTILLTNDDGIDAEGIYSLYKSFKVDGSFEIKVVAPNKETSAVGHAITCPSLLTSHPTHRTVLTARRERGRRYAVIEKGSDFFWEKIPFSRESL